MAEPIEMQLEMLSRMGPGNHVLDGDVDTTMVMGTFGVSWRLKSIVKHRILKVG